MVSRSKKLKSALQASRRTADQAQKSFLRAEDTLTAIEERESRQAARTQRTRSDIATRMPAAGGDRR